MSTVDELGYEIVKVPIKKVRVSSHHNKWYVEYIRKNPKFFVDRWWWYDDSTHISHHDAVIRAQVLAGLGYYELVVKKSKIEFEVGN